MTVPVPASQVFEFLKNHPSCLIERYEINSAPFHVLRRNIRIIITRLYEADDPEAREQADMLRAILSEWLTVPVPFDARVLESIAELGEPRLFEAKWGRDVRTAYDHAYKAATDLKNEENPARVQLRRIFDQLRAENKKWRIYCHRRAGGAFQSLRPDILVPLDSFLHSVKDYREAEPFDVLVKMGPLRARGWGSAPDALLSAPRFGALMQVVWSGCEDEEDFGYDPASAVSGPAVPVQKAASDHGVERSRVVWKQNIIKLGTSATEPSNLDVDELAYFGQLNRGTELRKATLVQLDNQSGILYPRHADVASFDPSSSAVEPIGYRIPGETLTEGLFVMIPVLGTADFGGMHTGEGHYSRAWKEKLKEMFQNAPNDLLGRLHDGGIRLRNLSHRIQQWCRPATTVIHAPQTKRHFEILIRVLGIEHDVTSPFHSGKHAWWEYAWREIARSRGEAIQTGMREHEIVYEELLGILNELLPELRQRAQNHEFFKVSIPANKPLHGFVRFHRIRSLEEGYLVPDTMLKIICDLDDVELWRA